LPRGFFQLLGDEAFEQDDIFDEDTVVALAEKVAAYGARKSKITWVVRVNWRPHRLRISQN
jgi:hypothetical protein